MTCHNFCNLIQFIQFLNNHKENKYESHIIPEDFDLTPDEPVKATCYVTVADTINILRMLYGETRDEDPDMLHLPPNWGTRHPDLIEKWFHASKLQDHHRAELGINQQFYDPEAGFGRRDILNHHSDTEHNSEDEQEHNSENEEEEDE